jgi:hypothetical protein
MPEAVILEFAGLTDAEYAAVNANLGIDQETGKGDWPAGMLSHAAGPAGDGPFVVVEVFVPGGPGSRSCSRGWARPA